MYHRNTRDHFNFKKKKKIIPARTGSDKYLCEIQIFLHINLKKKKMAPMPVLITSIYRVTVKMVQKRGHVQPEKKKKGNRTK